MRARVEDVTWRMVDGQAVILDLRDSSYFRTNTSGALLWDRLQTECGLDDLVAVLIEAFEVSRQVAERDVRTFLQTAQSRKLLVAVAEEPVAPEP